MNDFPGSPNFQNRDEEQSAHAKDAPSKVQNNLDMILQESTDEENDE